MRAGFHEPIRFRGFRQRERRVNDGKCPELLGRVYDFEWPEQLFEIHAATFQSDDVLLLAGDSADSDDPKPFLAGCSISEERTAYRTVFCLFLKQLISATPGFRNYYLRKSFIFAKILLRLNIEHRTSNIEHPTTNIQLLCIPKRHWTFGVNSLQSSSANL